MSLLLEICVESLEGARVAEAGGADRLELCADLVLGGTTPSLGMLRRVIAAVSIPVAVLVRPRAGDFHTNEAELEVMLEDIRVCGEEGAAAVVVGALLPDGAYDLEAMAAFREAAGDMEAVAHRAFDVARDPEQRLEELVRLGYARVLTSGGAARALDGAPLLAKLVRQAGDRITVLAGGGVREGDVRELVERTGVREVHASASALHDGPMSHRPAGPPMSAAQLPGEFERRITDPERVRAFRSLLG